jgi:AraC-like DNA-binding protein
MVPSNLTIQDIIAVNRLNYTVLRNTWHRDRPCYALTAKKKGRTLYESLKGQKFMSDENHILLIKKGITYSYTFEELGECIMIEFDGQLPEDLPQISSFGINVNLGIFNIFDKMESEWTFKRPSYRNSCMSTLYQIFAILERHETADTIPLRYYKLIQPSMEYMAKNYGSPDLDNDILAARSNMSTSYFRRLFKRIFFQTPMQYLLSIRIDKVKELLLTEQLSISEVSQMVGFSSVFYFDYVFKKETGMTPTEYIDLYVTGHQGTSSKYRKKRDIF